MFTKVDKAGANPLRDVKNGSAREIFVQLDQAGFVVNASQNAEHLGVDLQSLLLMPHIADFALGDHQRQVTQYFQKVMAGEACECKLEFPVKMIGRPNEVELVDPDNAEKQQGHDQHWYSLTLRRLDCDAEHAVGALGALQSVQHKYVTPQLTHKGAINDPFTGLADRRSFVGSLTSSIAMNETVSTAILAIDGMRAIFMQYGQGTADEIRWGFARFLETMVEPHHSLAQIDDERFGVILPGMRPKEARAWAVDTLQVFSRLAMPATGSEPELSASAGIARADLSAEWTIRQAELGLVMARSAGGTQAAICQPHSCLSNGRTVERAMESVVERSAKRMP
ncbi:GGDEF domain-containing protein [uncultured Erythrobacter sp.]|uniref:GGDEF domain-containing protein n=1 Tax=uncultured Erythrobacter sp. TaxID=263913 RepID=UPI0026201A61|nr:GGDEF domain-containing protein [uncultured Erythrobacter sp.]